MRIKVSFGGLSGTSLYLLSARILGAVAGIGLQILVARTYGAETLGSFYIAFGLTAVLSTIITMGFPWIIAPVVSESENSCNPELLRSFLRTANGHLAAMTVLVAVPILVILWWLPNLNDEFRWTLMLGVATAPLYALMELFEGHANARRFFALASIPDLMLRPLFLLCFVGIAVLITWPLDSVLLVGANLIITLSLAAAMGFLLNARIQAPTSGKTAPAPSESSPLTVTEPTLGSEQQSAWRKLAVPMIFSSLFVNLFADLQILIVGTLLPAADAAVFGVCIKITFLMAFAIQIVHQVMLRDASEAYATGSLNALGGVIRNANQFSVVVALAGLASLTVLGTWVLNIFGDDFTAGYGCLIILMVSQLVRAMAGPAIQILMISGNQRSAIPVYLASIAALLILNYLLIPTYGYIGAAVAVVCTTLIQALLLRRLVLRIVGINVSVFARNPGVENR